MNIPETITVYHGTIIKNLDSIIKNGLILDKNGIDKKLANLDLLNISEENKKNAVRRLLQAKSHGGVVYVSGDEEYARQNACASQEYLNIAGISRSRTHYRKIVVLKYVIPYREFKGNCKNSYLLDRFEELVQQGFFDRPDIKEFHKKLYNGEPLRGYHEFAVTSIPNKYLVSYTVWHRSAPAPGDIFDSYEFVEEINYKELKKLLNKIILFTKDKKITSSQREEMQKFLEFISNTDFSEISEDFLNANIEIITSEGYPE